jgi:hypothetical protein
MVFLMPRKKPLPTVSTAKTRLEELQAMRRVLARAIDDEGTPARELSPLVRRLEELGVAIEELEAVQAEERMKRAEAATADGAWTLNEI